MPFRTSALLTATALATIGGALAPAMAAPGSFGLAAAGPAAAAPASTSPAAATTGTFGSLPAAAPTGGFGAAPPGATGGQITAALNQVAAGASAPASAATQPGGAPPAGPVPLSALPAPAPLQVIGAAQASQPVEFEVILPLTNAAGMDTLLSQLNTPGSPLYHQWLSPSAFASRFGPNPVLMNQAAMFLQAFGLTVTIQTRSLHVKGTAAQVNALFGVALQLATDPVGHVRLLAGGPVNPPGLLKNLGIVVPAFQPGTTDATPLVRRSAFGYVRRSAYGYVRRSAYGYGQNGNGPTSYLFDDLKEAYGYPAYNTPSGTGANSDGTGATVAVVMSSDVADSDVAGLFNMDSFTANSGQASNPAIFARRPVDGGPSTQFDSDGAEEATLDVEQVLGGAPGAHVVLYDTPDLSDQSLISAITAIDNDNVADVVSMSYGQCELYYTAAYNNGSDQTPLLNTYSELYKQGNLQGITFLAGTGDSGGLGCLTPGYFNGQGGSFIPGVSVPAADPSVTGVGGTNLVTAESSGTGDASYVGENAFADLEPALDPLGQGYSVSGGVFGAGGGVSTLFAKPSYQNLVQTGSSSYRTLPDIGMEVGGCPDDGSGMCDPLGLMTGDTGQRSNVAIMFGGQPDFMIGSSVATPELASVVALMVQAGGRQGNINPMLYAAAQREAAGGASYFHQAIPGNNGLVADGGTYNYATGNGTPNVAVLLGRANAPLAGTPGTPTNP